MSFPFSSSQEIKYPVKWRPYHGRASTPELTAYRIVKEGDQTHIYSHSPMSLLTICHSHNHTALLLSKQNTRPWKNSIPIKEHCRILYQFEFTNFMSPHNSLGILFQFVLLRTDFGLGDCLLLLSIPSVLLSVEGGFRDTAMWLGPDKKNSVTHLQITPIPALGSEHIHGVSQLIPGREHPRDEVPFGSAWWNYRQQSGLTENPSFSSSTRRIHGRTLNQPLHLIEPQFSLL